MKVTKTGSTTEVERKRLEGIKAEVEKVKNWTKECKCEGCESEFTININDIKRVYFGLDSADDYSAFRYGLNCPICGKEYTISTAELPQTGAGYDCLKEIFKQNRVEKYDSLNWAAHKVKIMKRKYRYFK